MEAGKDKFKVVVDYVDDEFGSCEYVTSTCLYLWDIIGFSFFFSFSSQFFLC